MEHEYIENQLFNKGDFSLKPLPKGEYDQCTFKSCNFLNADLSHIVFIDCIFSACDLSMARLLKTSFQNVSFHDCKMMGMRFDHCNDFALEVSFDQCILSHTSFYNTRMRKTLFKNSVLSEADFTECDATAALFEECDLTRATFDRTLLEMADFRTSFNFSIDPEINRLKKAKFSMTGLSGLLEKYGLEIS